jgi:predicted O-methyltransferase YrrM
MSIGFINLTPDLQQYIADVSLRETPLQKELREITANMPQANMQIAAEQGQFMALMAKLIKAKNVIEVGVFTGYSSLAVALALPEDGNIVACDIDKEWTDIAQTFWAKAGVSHKIGLRLAPAIETLQQLINEGRSGEFDMAFIDADKISYADYFELCLELMRPGGIILIDNVLWDGAVVDTNDQTEDTVAIRSFNRSLHNDERIDLSMIPVADGLTLAVKR